MIKEQSKETLLHIDALSALALQCMAEREKAMGSVEGGIFNYYSTRIRSGRLFLAQELTVVRWVMDNLKDADVIIDIGCGVGQDAFLWAANGMRCIAVEGDYRRYAALVALKDAVGKWNPQIGERVATRQMWYPAKFEGISEKKTIAFFGCFLHESLKDEAALIRSLRQFSGAIVDLVRFGPMKRETKEKQAELIEMLAAESLVSVASITSWSDGNFQYFKRSGD